MGKNTFIEAMRQSSRGRIIKHKASGTTFLPLYIQAEMIGEYAVKYRSGVIPKGTENSVWEVVSE